MVVTREILWKENTKFFFLLLSQFGYHIVRYWSAALILFCNVCCNFARSSLSRCFPCSFNETPVDIAVNADDVVAWSASKGHRASPARAALQNGLIWTPRYITLLSRVSMYTQKKNSYAGVFSAKTCSSLLSCTTAERSMNLACNIIQVPRSCYSGPCLLASSSPADSYEVPHPRTILPMNVRCALDEKSIHHACSL